MFLGFLWSKTDFAIFHVFFNRFDVYEAIVTSHGNLMVLIVVDMDRGDKTYKY